MESENNMHKENSVVVQQAIRITTILNKHVISEENCKHTIKQLALDLKKAFE